jgi:outer membrane lipoprotein-sorting protein
MSMISRINRRRALFAGMSALALPVLAADPAPTGSDTAARTLLEQADLVRFPAGGFEVDVLITSRAPDQEDARRRYRVLSKGNDNTIVMTVEPASERGQAMLMKGRDLWIFLPNVSQPVRLPLSQRLTGQVANGDLARANFTGDYVPTLLRSDTMGGEDMHVLELHAVDKAVTYNRVVYWIRRANNWPHRAQFFSTSGRLLKTASYENFAMLGGRSRPTRLVLTDALREGEQSVLDYSNLKARELPDRMFTKDYLKRLE